MNTPDVWVIIKVTPTGEAPIYRVLAGWYGGYMGGDAWQINSGIVSYTKTKTFFDFHGASGSVYRCFPHSEKLSGLTQSILTRFTNQMQESGKGTIEVVPVAEVFKALKKK